MEINLKMFCSIMEHGISSYLDAVLVVTLDCGRFSVPKPSFLINLLSQTASHVVFARALHSDSYDDLDVTLCFFEVHAIGVLSIVNIYIPVDLHSSVSSS